MVWNDNGIPDTVIDVKLPRGGPTILRERLPHIRPEYRVCPVSDFRVCVEQSESGVGHSDSRSTGAAIRKLELAVLVVGAGRTGADVDFVVIVLSGPLEHTAELQGVASPDPGKTIGQPDNGTAGMRWIRAAVQRREVRHSHRRDAIGLELAIRKYVRIVEHAGQRTCLRPVEEVCRINRNPDDVLTCRRQELIDHRWTDRPDMIQRIRLVWPVEKLRCAIGVPIQWLVLEVGIVLPAECDPL